MPNCGRAGRAVFGSWDAFKARLLRAVSVAELQAVHERYLEEMAAQCLFPHSPKLLQVGAPWLMYDP